jgi:hypothetical protein
MERRSTMKEMGAVAVFPLQGAEISFCASFSR